MSSEWRFFAQPLPEFGYPVPTLAYRNASGVNLAMLVFNPNNTAAYLILRKKGFEEVQDKERSIVTGKIRLLPVFTPMPPSIASPRQFFIEQGFNETERTYSLGLGRVVENSLTIRIISLLQHAEWFFLLDKEDQVVFQVRAKVEAQQAHAFIAFCAP